MKKRLIFPLVVGGLAFLGLYNTNAVVPENEGEYVENRARLVSYVIKEQLNRNHYSHKAVDDTLSLNAFDLFVEQLDSQKRFLLQDDYARLKKYDKKIDDEFKMGRFELPEQAYKLFPKRLDQVRKMVVELVAEGLNPEVQESIETDIDNIEFAASTPELRERWRKIVKYQILTRYLSLKEDKVAAGEKVDQKVLLEEAGGKVLASFTRFFDRLAKDTIRDFYDRYFNAVTRAFDPHTNYFPPKQKEDFDISMRGSLEGIGALLREEDGFIKVERVIPGSAAARQGQLAGGDKILQVAEGAAEPVDITDMRLRDAVSLIRGKKGTEVRLTVRHADGKRVVIPIVRDVVQIEETFVKHTVRKQGDRLFGYIKIPTFYRDFKNGNSGGRNSTTDTQRAIKALLKEKVDGIVLDLRNNGGGALTDAVSIAGLFIDKGPIVQVRSSDDIVQSLADEQAGYEYDGPLVVLVNKFSASASEILAGALQDYGRAIIVGSHHTHGKGTVQTLIDLDRSVRFGNMGKYKPLGALKMTTQKFYRVSGASTQSKGVEPDIVLPDPMAYLESGEQYIDHALPWDTIKPVSYRKWDKSLNLATLTVMSGKRIAASDDFAEVVEKSQENKERSEKTQISLLLADIEDERNRLNGNHGEKVDDEDETEGDNEEEDSEGEGVDPDWTDALNEDIHLKESEKILANLIAINRK